MSLGEFKSFVRNKPKHAVLKDKRLIGSLYEGLAVRFYVRRKVREDHPLEYFYLHDPRTELLSTLLTCIPVNHYYMSKDEARAKIILDNIRAVQADPEFHLNAMIVAREVARRKDSVVYASIIRSHMIEKESDSRHMDMLRKISIPLMYKFASTKIELGTHTIGMRNFHRKIFRKTIKNMMNDPDTLARNYIKYGRHFRYVMKAVKIDRETYNEIKRIVFRTKIYKYYAMLRKAYGRGDTSGIVDVLENMEATATPLSRTFYSLPRAPAINDRWIELFKKYATPFDIVMYGVSALRRGLSGSELVKLVKERTNIVPPSYLLRLADTIADKRIQLREYVEDPVKLANDIYMVAFNRSRKILDELDFSMVLVIDRSGSMAGRPIRLATQIASLLLPKARKIYGFNDDVWEEEYNNPIDLLTNHEADHMTDIALALETAKRDIRSGEADVIFLITDEQENGSKHASEAIDPDTPVIVSNPVSYPAHAIAIKRNVLLLPSSTPEGVSVALTLLNIYKQHTEKKIDIKEIIETDKKKKLKIITI